MNKKILIFVPEFPVTSETFIEREIFELVKRGNLDIQVASFKKGSSFNFEELKNISTYLEITTKDVIAGFIWFAVKNFIDMWKTYFLALKNREGNLFGNVYIWAKSLGYAHKLSRFSFDHIHAHFLSKGSTIPFYASILLNVPFSVSGHAKDVFGTKDGPDMIPSKLRYASFAALCNKKAYVHCVNVAGIQDKLKPYLIQHGLAVSAANHTNKKIQDGITKIFSLGRIVEKKGLIYLIEAAKILRDENEKFEVWIAGYGPLYSELVQLTNEFSLGDRIKFINDGTGVSNKEALEYMSQADIFVVPSIDLDSGDSDGIPNNILEAGVYALPVVATGAGSIAEVIRDNDTGLVVGQKDSEALASAIKKIMHNPDLAKRLGVNLNKFVTQNFDIQKNIVELEKLLLG